MPTIPCPGCRRKIQLGIDDLTKTIECSVCNARFDPMTGKVILPPIVIHNDDDNPVTDAPPPVRIRQEPEPDYDPIYEPSPRSGSSAAIWAMFGMIALVALTVIVVAIFKSGSDAPVAKKGTNIDRAGQAGRGRLDSNTGPPRGGKSIAGDGVAA
jgi:hypothetical protein